MEPCLSQMMESNELGPVVKTIGMGILAAQPPRHTRQVAPQGDQIPVHSENALFVINSGPADRNRILEPAIFQQLL